MTYCRRGGSQTGSCWLLGLLLGEVSIHVTRERNKNACDIITARLHNQKEARLQTDFHEEVIKTTSLFCYYSSAQPVQD